MKLQDKIAVVTGGGRGIGRAICLAFADEGANVVVAADVTSQVKDVAAEVERRQRKALAYRFDVVKPDEVEALQKATLTEFGKVDVLVNCAGVVGKRAFAFDTDDAEWRRVIEVNLFGTYYCVKRFLPVMMGQGEGRIINIASISGKQASPTNVAYSASKHVVIGLTRTVAAEMGLLGIPGITVNAICPGVVNTDMILGDGGVVDEIARILRISRDQVAPTENLKNGLNAMSWDLSELSAGKPSYGNTASRLGDPFRLGSRGPDFEKDSHNSSFGLSPSEAGDASFGFTELCPNSALPAQTQETGKKAGKFERGLLPGQ